MSGAADFITKVLTTSVRELIDVGSPAAGLESDYLLRGGNDFKDQFSERVLKIIIEAFKPYQLELMGQPFDQWNLYNNNKFDDPSLFPYNTKKNTEGGKTIDIAINSQWFGGKDTENFQNNYSFLSKLEKLSILNMAKEVPTSFYGNNDKKEGIFPFIDPSAGQQGLISKFQDFLSEFIIAYNKWKNAATSYLNTAMYNSVDFNYQPDVKAFFTNYVGDDIGNQFQEIRVSDGRIFTRMLAAGIWSNWTLSSPEATGIQSFELTSGDIGAMPLGSQYYKFNKVIEPMKAGETIYCLTRDVMLSGLPESLRYGSIGYKNTADDLLAEPLKRLNPNSLGCYNLFDPNNDINEPDSNGMMEVMPSLEMFSEDVPRPILEQQRGMLKTMFDGVIYWQDWQPMSPTNINWCDEYDKPRYLYYRKGTKQIADQITGKLPFIKWTKWYRQNNIETIKDFGIVSIYDIEKEAGFPAGVEEAISSLSLPEVYNQPNDTTYMWTLKDFVNSDLENKPQRISGLPSVLNESGPPIKLIPGNTVAGGPFRIGAPAPIQRRSIFSKITITKTEDIVYMEWRDLGQLAETEQDPVTNRWTKKKNLTGTGWDLELPKDMASKYSPWANTFFKGSLPVDIIPTALFRLKEDSSNFCYYREGRVEVNQDLKSLPDKVFNKVTKWNAWHSIDGRLKSIEGRLNFIEVLQNLPPGSHYYYLPVMSQDLTAADKLNNGKSSLLEELGDPSLQSLNSIPYIGEATPHYFLKTGYNFGLDLFDTQVSYWGSYTAESILGDLVKPNIASRMETIRSRDNKIQRVTQGEGRTLLTGNTSNFRESKNYKTPIHSRWKDLGKQTIGYTDPEYGVLAVAIRDVSDGIQGAMWDWITANIFAAKSASLLIKGLGIAGAVLAVLLVAQIAATLLFMGSMILSRISGGKEWVKKMATPANTIHEAWLPTDIKILTAGSDNSKYSGSRSTSMIDNAGGAKPTTFAVDTGIWGWLLELKRRTDVIKPILSTLMIFCGWFRSIAIAFGCMQWSMATWTDWTVPASGVMPIPFFAFGLPGLGVITGYDMCQSCVSFPTGTRGAGIAGISDEEYFPYGFGSCGIGPEDGSTLQDNQWILRTLGTDISYIDSSDSK
jgi:hypothetical protein